MGNTIITSPVLVARTLLLLQEPTLFEIFANTEYEGDLANQGDTVTVQNFPIIEWNDVASGTKAQDKAGNAIEVQDWALGSSQIVVDQVATINLKIKSIEKVLSNLNLEAGLRLAVVQGNKRKRSRAIRDELIAGAGNVVGSVTDIATKENVMDAFVDKAVEELDNDFVEEEGRVLVVRTDFYNLIKENSSWDGTSVVPEMRKKGILGEIAGLTVFKDNTLPEGTALAFKSKAVHFIKKFNNVRVATKDSNHEGNWDNIIGEMVYKAKVLPPNAPRICKILYTTEVPS